MKQLVDPSPSRAVAAKTISQERISNLEGVCSPSKYIPIRNFRSKSKKSLERDTSVKKTLVPEQANYDSIVHNKLKYEMMGQF